MTGELHPKHMRITGHRTTLLPRCSKSIVCKDLYTLCVCLSVRPSSPPSSNFLNSKKTLTFIVFNHCVVQMLCHNFLMGNTDLGIWGHFLCFVVHITYSPLHTYCPFWGDLRQLVVHIFSHVPAACGQSRYFSCLVVLIIGEELS